MGSGGIFHKFWCDKCQCYVDFSDFETCESICEYCKAGENKARAEAAEAEVGRLRAELAAMPRPEDRCHGEWPCEASTALAFAEAEMARAEARADAAEAEAARSARFLGECGYLVGIEVYSPDDIPVILDRLGDLHIRAEAAEAEVARLRAELAQARADAEAAGRAAERAAVVAWLHKEYIKANAATHRIGEINLLHRLTQIIERGAHRKEE